MPSIQQIEIKGIDKGKPKLKSDGMVIPFYKTKKSLKDLEEYNRFIKGVEKLVRISKEYKAYKNFLMSDIGLNYCTVLPNISTELGKGVTIEMHHGPILTLYDYCSIMVDHMLENDMAVTSIIVAAKIIEEHELHNIQVVMLCDLVHKLCHTNGSHLYINPKQAWGKLDVFLEKYKDGIDDRRRAIIKTNLELAQQYHSIDKNELLTAYKAQKWDDR